MATKKDLVEAYQFSRRRLVTAFVSGAPGGREVEPTRPGRTIIGGVALAVLLLAGAGVLGILKAPVEVDWSQEGLVSDKDSGADYVVVATGEDAEPELRPVANITSALLLFGSDTESREVSGDEIASRTLGAPIGILEAPPTPPPTSALIQTGWTACSGVGPSGPLGVKVDLAEEPQVEPAPDTGFVVKSGGELYLVAEATPLGRSRPTATVYRVPARRDAILGAVAGTNTDDAVPVPPSWLAVFPQGGDLSLETLGLPEEQIGQPATQTRGGLIPARARYGQRLVNGDTQYLLTPGGVIRLSPFAAAVVANAPFPRGTRAEPKPIEGPPGIGEIDPPLLDWPEETLETNTSEQVCGLLDTVSGEQPGVRLAVAPGEDADSSEVPEDRSDVTVESGHGAFVVRGAFDSEGTQALTLVDVRGYAFPVAGGDERTNLGYGSEPDVVVPDSWLDLMRTGVPLSIDAARCPPTSDERSRPCGDGQ